MSDYRLRNHIPLSGPATREPFIGDEPDLRVSLGFTPAWYHRKLGIDFSQKWHLDPFYRYETLVKMKSLLNETFPMVPYFKVNFANGMERTCATISGVHGAVLMSLVYGQEAVYGPAVWPAIRPESRLPREEIEKLEPFDLLSNPVVVQLLEQLDTIERNWGQISGYLNYQGILNNAFRIRGDEIFIDMLVNPELVHHLFGHIAKTILALARLVQNRQRKSGFAINLLSMSNCTVNMISPELYKKFVLPYDMMLSREFERFGIHNCNWNVDPYLEAYRTIEKMGYLDMGIDSDLPRAREMFPDARRAIMYHPVALEQKTAGELKEDIEKIYRGLAPCDIVLGDVEETTPDARVIEFLQIVEDCLTQGT